MRIKSRLAIAATTAAVSAVFLIPNSASAATSACSGSACDNQSPTTMGCDTADVRTVQHAYVEDVKLEFRWSDSCKAGWATGEVLQITSLNGVTGYIEKYDATGKLLGSSSVVPIIDQKNLSTMQGGQSRYALCWKVDDPFGSGIKECSTVVALP